MRPQLIGHPGGTGTAKNQCRKAREAGRASGAFLVSESEARESRLADLNR